MKKIVIIISLILSCAARIVAQSDAVVERYKTIVSDVYAEIPSNKITTGLLIEKAIPNVNTGKFDGSKSCDTSTLATWQKLYRQFCFAHVDYSTVDCNQNIVERAEAACADAVPVGVLLFAYNQIKAEAVSNHQIVLDTVRGKVIDASSWNTQVLDEKICCAVTPFAEQLEVGTYTFSIPEQSVVGNKTNTIQSIEIDFADGQGFVPVGVGTSRSVTYTVGGEKVIKTRIYASGKIYYSTSVLFVNDETSENLLKGYSFGMEPDYGPTSFESNSIEAEYAVYGRCNNDGTIRKPCLIVSGFDPMDNNRLVDDGNKVNLYRISNKNGFLDKLRNEGYDIILYRSKNSTESIIPNAKNLVDFIQKINAEKMSDNELIIAGASMGGLVVRYALTYMEYYGIDHQTKLFISVDSPQEGANVPLGIQYMVKYLNSDLLEVLAALKNAEDTMLNSDAAKEMLLYHHTATSGKTAQASSMRNTFLSSLERMGNFPQECRTIAISMGSGNGTGQGFSAGARLMDKDPKLSYFVPGAVPVPHLSWEFSVYAVPNNTNSLVYSESVNYKTCIRILNTTHCTSGQTLASRKEYVNNTMPIDNAPGSIRNLHNLKDFRNNGSLWGIDYIDLIDFLGEIDYDSKPDNFIPSYSSLGLEHITNPSLNIKTYLNQQNAFRRMSDNLYVKTSASDVSLFDVLYVENKNLDHIYDDNKIGVFTEEMTNMMLQEAAPETIYVENETMKQGHRKAAEARGSVFIGNSVDGVQYNDGDVVMESGSQTSVLASEKIVLKSGTKINHGAQFSAKIGNFSYCDESDANYVKSYNLESYGSDEAESTENDLVSLVVDYSEPVIIYPNPVDDRLYVSSNKTNNTITFYDVNGKKVLSQTFHKNVEIDCSKLPVGTYVVRVVQGNGNVETKQIFKQ